jgi:diguanylate cyclase (GGDEF)-like protein/PAS domain S-box-containing protein
MEGTEKIPLQTIPASMTWRLTPWIVVLVGLAFTAIAAFGFARREQIADRRRFDRLSDRLVSEIQRRVGLYEYGLRGARGLFVASDHVTREEFARYNSSRDTQREFPGALGVGFVRRVERGRLTEFLDSTRADGSPFFTLRTSGAAGDLRIIEYIEPLERNRASEGFDIGSDSMRREASNHAMHSGSIALTPPVTLVQAERSGAGFLVFLPVYKSGKSTSSRLEREEALIGWTYMPLLMSEIMRGLVLGEQHEIEVKIDDSEIKDASGTLFESEAFQEAISAHEDRTAKTGSESWLLCRETPIDFGGRLWHVKLVASPRFEHYSRISAWICAITGTLLSGVLGGLVASMHGARRRAERRAAEMTVDLQAQTERAEDAMRGYQFIVDALNRRSIVSAADRSGKITEVNDAFCKISGYSREELIGQDHRLVNSGVHPKEFWVEMWRAIATGQSWRRNVCNRAKDGSQYWVDSLVVPFLDASGRIERYISIRSDITQRKRTEATMHALLQTLTRVGEIAHIGAWEYELSTKSLMLTEAAYSIFELSTGVPITMEELVTYYAPESQQWIASALETAIASGEPWDLELQLNTARGTSLWIRTQGEAVRIEGQTTKLYGIVQDITERKQSQAEIERMALSDKLTGLPNRALLLDRVQQEIRRHQRQPERRFALMFLDFDRFKIINDTMGHEAGDQLLMQIAARLREDLRAPDSVALMAEGHTAARIGGDEFVVLLEDLHSDDDAENIAQRLVRVLSEPYWLGAQRVTSTASIGLVKGCTSYSQADQMLRDADTAMYEAKAAGKGRYVVFDEAMRERVLRRSRLENDLKGATDRGELSVNYQPVVNLTSGEIESLEALVRWTHPSQGPITPAEFIPIAEESGTIEPIGLWVLAQACAQLAKWRCERSSCAHWTMAVNLSRKQLSNPHLLDHLLAAIEHVGLPSKALCLEITETAVMRDPKASLAQLQRLKQAGFRLALDDFGTGLSSLSTLHEFPLDVVKLDRGFTINMNHGAAHAAMVQAVVTLAANLKLSVVVEGVETEDQLATLQALDCRCGQGWLFGKPMPASGIDDLIHAQRLAA